MKQGTRYSLPGYWTPETFFALSRLAKKVKQRYYQLSGAEFQQLIPHSVKTPGSQNANHKQLQIWANDC